MPLQTQPKQLQIERMTNFLGVNLRADRLATGEGDMSKSINADLDAFPGTITRRYGTQIFRILGATAEPIRLIRRFRGDLSGIVDYVVGGSNVFVGSVSSDSGYSLDGSVSMVEYKSLNETFSRVFVASENQMRRVTRGDAFPWGIAPPDTAPFTAVGSATGLTGDYRAVYTYARRQYGQLIHESNPSPAPTAVTLANESLAVTVLRSDDDQVTHIRIYRTTAGGSTYLFDRQVANVFDIIQLNQADSFLGVAVDEENDQPPVGSLAIVHNDRVWIANNTTNPSRLHYSRKFLAESFPAANFIDVSSFNDPITALASLHGQLMVFTRDRKYRIIEQVAGVQAIGGTEIPFIGSTSDGYLAVEGASRRGTEAPDTVVSSEFGIIFVAIDGVFITNVNGQDQFISTAIQPIFNARDVNEINRIDFTKFPTMIGEFYKRRYYWAYASNDTTSQRPDTMLIYSFETQAWYQYSYDEIRNLSSLYYSAENDRLHLGDIDGTVYFIEEPNVSQDVDKDGTAADPTMTIELSSREGGDRFVRKLFMYFRVDAFVPSGESLTAEFVVDDLVKRTATITGNRTTVLQRLPEATRGFNWSVNFSYTGDTRPQIFGVNTAWLPLLSA